jgi:hypothetical protein
MDNELFECAEIWRLATEGMVAIGVKCMRPIVDLEGASRECLTFMLNSICRMGYGYLFMCGWM